LPNQNKNLAICSHDEESREKRNSLFRWKKNVWEDKKRTWNAKLVSHKILQKFLKILHKPQDIQALHICNYYFKAVDNERAEETNSQTRFDRDKSGGYDSQSEIPQTENTYFFIAF